MMLPATAIEGIFYALSKGQEQKQKQEQDLKAAYTWMHLSPDHKDTLAHVKPTLMYQIKQERYKDDAFKALIKLFDIMRSVCGETIFYLHVTANRKQVDVDVDVGLYTTTQNEAQDRAQAAKIMQCLYGNGPFSTDLDLTCVIEKSYWSKETKNVIENLVLYVHMEGVTREVPGLW